MLEFRDDGDSAHASQGCAEKTSLKRPEPRRWSVRSS